MAYDPFKNVFFGFGAAVAGDHINFRFGADPAYQFDVVSSGAGSFEFNASATPATAAANFEAACNANLPANYVVERQSDIVRIYTTGNDTRQAANIFDDNGSAFYIMIDAQQQWDFDDLAWVSVTKTINSITLRAWGSNRPIEFQLDDGAWQQGGYEPAYPAYMLTFSSVGSGSHTVRVRDGFHQLEQTVVLNPIVAGYNKTNVTCNGADNGTIVLSVSGGTAPYTYAWADGPTTKDRTGLGPGNFGITITDAIGDTKSLVVQITEPSAINISAAENGHDISLTPSGGTGPYTYAWSDGPTTKDRAGLAPGEYTVTITDANGCTTQRTFTIESTLIVSGEIDLNTIALTVTGGTGPYTYAWNDGPTTKDRTGLAPGNYTVTVTDSVAATAQESFTIDPAGNTGLKIYTVLEEYDVLTGQATGNTKPNDPEDPDYIAPVNDPTSCPI